MGPHPFERLFAPRAVVVFGVEGDDVGRRILHNLAAAGFPGPLHAVGVRHAGPGVRPAGSLADVEGPLDLAVLAVPAPELLALVRACGERGVAGAVVPVLAPEAGRGDLGPLARELREEAARHGLRLLGPNSVGLLRPAARLAATLSGGATLPGSLALVTQSGALCTTVLDWAAAHRIGFSAVASLGDAVDVDFGDVLEYLAFDAETRSVLLHVERVRSARAFLSGLRLAARLKPVVVVKAGRHPATADRDAPVPSADDAFDAALARVGAVRVASVEQLFAAAQLLGTGRRVAGNRLAVVANARGPALLAADRAADLGVVLPAPGEAARGRLDALLPAAGPRRNPVDLLADAGPDRYRAAVEICRDEPGVDAVLALFAPQARARPLETAEAVVAASRGSAKPLLACWMGEELVRTSRARFVEAGVSQFSTPEAAVEAFDLLARHARSQRLLRQAAGPITPEAVPLVDQARDAVQRALAAGRGPLTTTETRKLLGAFGVRLEGAPGSRVRGTELHVSVARDGTFGPVIRFGPGAPGITAQRIVALPPLNTAIIRTLVESSRVAGALSPAGALVADEVAALERMLWALSELVCELPELRELELHPLVPVRGALVALGARVTAASPEPGARRYGHLAIHPYPGDVGARWHLADGTRVTVRPIRPEDARMEARFVRDLSPMTRYFRFMVPIRELDDEALVRFTQLDYDRELALLAVVEKEGEEDEIAVARYVMLPDGRSAELAIVVADAWQGKGLGGRLLGMLVEVARARGVPRLEGEVLAENAASRAMLRRLGFTLRRHPEGPQTFLFEKDLGSL